MTKYREVENIIAPPPPHMVGDGFRVHNFFPSSVIGEKRMSPFYLLDYNSKIDFAPSDEPRGVGVHPHRGFETVTIAYKGKIAHHDSSGNKGIIEEGDVQWMTAASGVLHKEYHEQEFSKKGGPFHMVQLWVNLPAKYKMTEPKYQAIDNGKIKKVELADNSGRVEVIAGEYKGIKGPAFTFTPINMYNIHLKKGKKIQLSIPEFYNAGILVIEGSAIINEKEKAGTDHFILFRNVESDVLLEADEDSTYLLLSGEPIDEPIAAYGPFLMNKHEELEIAVSDFSQGKFGKLED